MLPFIRDEEHRKGRSGCVQILDTKICQAQKALNTDSRTNYAVKYATARGHLRSGFLCQEAFASNLQDKNEACPVSMANPAAATSGEIRNAKIQKNPRVRKIRVRNSGAGNGSPNFMDTWKKCVLSAGKPVSIKFLVLEGGGILGLGGGGGGKCRFYFYGRADFSEKSQGFLNVHAGIWAQKVANDRPIFKGGGP